MRSKHRPRGIRWVSTFLTISIASMGLHAPLAVAAPPTTASELDSAFETYGDSGGRWAGGDGTVSVELPDGRIVWLFSDTFIGAVNPDHSLATSSKMVNNTMVIQSDSLLTTTLTGGTAAAPTAIVETGVTDEYYWIGDAAVEGNTLKAVYNRFQRTGTGTLDFSFIGTWLATFSLPTLSLTSMVALPLDSNIAWGASLLTDDGFTYVYGTELTAASGMKFAHLARVPAGGLSGAWQFWTGSTWSADSASSARLLSGVGATFGVQVIGGQFVLVTAESNIPFNPQVVAYTATSPTGPFSGPVDLFVAPEPEPSGTKAIIVYNAQLHPEQAPSGKLLISYDVNSLEPADVKADIRNFRPRFVEVTWPRPVPDAGSVPASPTNLVATPDSSGTVHLTWQAPSGLTFNVYLRDVTSGQTHLVRVSTSAQNSADVAFLTTERTYEFRVSAVNSAGEGPMSNVAAGTVVTAPPDSPTGVTATANNNGKITVSWTPVPHAWSYDVYRRDVTAGETELSAIQRGIRDGTSFTNSDTLQHQHVYEFMVTAMHGGGESPKSAPASATAFYALPDAPTGLAATANADGTIGLAWTDAQPDVWFSVYQRDVTAGEPTFTLLPLPVTSCCAMTAGYLTHNHRYEYKVAATNAGGEGPASGLVSKTAAYPAPAAPTTLTGIAGDGQVALSWSSADTNAWFNVYQRDVTAAESVFTLLPLPVTACCAMTAGYLANGHTYEFRVTSTNAVGESSASNTIAVVPQVALPGAVTGVSASANGDGSVTVAWTPPAGSSLWFNVYQRDVTAGESSFTKLPLPTTSCCSMTAGYLVHNHGYEFKVAATNGGGDGPLSSAASVTASYNTPAAPTDLRGVSSGDGSVTLDWNGPPSGLAYWIYQRDVTAGQSWQKLPFPVMSCCTMTAGYLVNGHVYEFKVTGENQGGEGMASNIIQVTAYGGLPQAPSNLTVAAGDGQAVLTWTASPTANVAYWVYQRDVTAGQSWQKLPLPIMSCCTMTAGYLTNGHTYEWKVTASNSAGDSSPTNAAGSRPMPPLPQPPSALSASAGDGTVTLTWTGSPTPNVSYWVYQRDVTAGQSWQKLPLPVTSCCTFNGGFLVNGHTYEWKLLASNMTGASGYSNTVSARPMPPFPQMPTGLSANVGDAKVTLHWSASATPNVWYLVYQRDVTTGQSWQQLPLPVTSCCTFNGGLLTNGHTYEWKIAATNLSGISSFSGVVSGRPMPPAPKAPSWMYGTSGPNSVTLHWNASTTPGVQYRIYYRNVSRGETSWTRFPASTSATSATLYRVLSALNAYELQIAAFNLTGEAKTASTVIEVPWRQLPFTGGPIFRHMNDLNDSNDVAALWALDSNLPCQYDYYQVVCFGPAPRLGIGAVTVGDFQFFNKLGGAATLEAELVCEVWQRLNLRQKYSQAVADVQGPDLLRHEAAHSFQWARYFNWTFFIYEYLKDPMRFEREANLYWGGYQVHPDVKQC